ncbi:MAG: DNA alkylation repair protein, partial [Fusobacterium sp.]|nr:DNA alkylation repair protein [Fusobacterium sp.]
DMDYTLIKWNKKNYELFIDELKKMQDEKYREFHNKIIGAEVEVIGLRSPIVKDIAKKIAKGDWEGFLAQKKGKYYEETTLRGQVIGFAKADKETIKKYIERYIDEIDNWGICATFIGNLKIIKKEKEYFYPMVKRMAESEEQWKIRFGLITLMSCYIEKEYINEIFRICSRVKNKEYYVQMGQAWLISTLFIKFRDETLEYLKDNSLDKWTQNKAIQKIRESFRVSEEDKELVKSLKK